MQQKSMVVIPADMQADTFKTAEVRQKNPPAAMQIGSFQTDTLTILVE